MINARLSNRPCVGRIVRDTSRQILLLKSQEHGAVRSRWHWPPALKLQENLRLTLRELMRLTSILLFPLGDLGIPIAAE